MSQQVQPGLNTEVNQYEFFEGAFFVLDDLDRPSLVMEQLMTSPTGDLEKARNMKRFFDLMKVNDGKIIFKIKTT
jgi:hypothetical protein